MLRPDQAAYLLPLYLLPRCRVRPVETTTFAHRRQSRLLSLYLSLVKMFV